MRIADAARDGERITLLAGYLRPWPFPASAVAEDWDESDWSKPYDDSRLLDLMSDDDVDWVIDNDRVLVHANGVWSKQPLPFAGRMVATVDHVLSQSGEAFAVRDGGQWRSVAILHPRGVGLCHVVSHGGRLFGVTGLRARDQVCELIREADGFRCVPFGTVSAGPVSAVPGGVIRVAALSDGSLVVGGSGLYVASPGDDSWTVLRRFATRRELPAATPSRSRPRLESVVCVAVTSDDEILATTSEGTILAGTRDGVAEIGSVRGPFGPADPVLSVVRFLGSVFVSTAWEIYRETADGFVPVKVPAPTHEFGPTHGTLSIVDGRLWLAGTYCLQSTDDGIRWSSVSIRPAA